MTKGKGSATAKVLRTHRQAVGWTLLLSNLFLLLLAIGGLLLWHLLQYAGSWRDLLQAAFTRFELSFFENPPQIVLFLTADGLDPLALDITQELSMLFVMFLLFLLLQGIVRAIADAVWHHRSRRYLQQLSTLAQEARRLTEEERSRSTLTPKVDQLEEAIDHISPTQTARLQMHDPDLQGLEDAINDLLDRMQAAYSQQTQFVSDASHELRTPIAILKGYADLLERWGKDDPQVRDEAIHAIQTEADRMRRLVDQLLFLARGDSGRAPLQKTVLDLAALIGEVWEESRMIDPNHNWVLDAPQPVSFTGDGDLLKQALRVLADNAAKYSPIDSTIVLRCGIDETGAPCLTVRDHGMGIKQQDLPHIFDRFYRSDPARSRQSGGSGLGLAIAHWIVARHGGHIQVSSWEGVGTRFAVLLPKTP